ncbi:MAG: phosphoribosylglycinamide formyltransferase [Nevskiales bacterium]
MKQLPSLAVLISGKGRNLQAILDACRDGRIAAEPALIVSSRPGAPGLELAQAFGVPTAVLDPVQYQSREDYDAALVTLLERAQADLIALAGFMRILTPDFVRRYSGRLFNIHPSLLPRYRGLGTHAKVLAAGDLRHGASVHYVTDELDGGPVVLQGSSDVVSGDTVEKLAERVMCEVEIRIYPRVLAWAAAGRLKLQAGKVVLDGRALDAPLQLEEMDEH